jgi:hypothetical protein
MTIQEDRVTRLGSDCGSGGRWFKPTQLYHAFQPFILSRHRWSSGRVGLCDGNADAWPKSLSTRSPTAIAIGLTQVPVMITWLFLGGWPNRESSLTSHVSARRGSPNTLAPWPVSTSTPFFRPWTLYTVRGRGCANLLPAVARFMATCASVVVLGLVTFVRATAKLQGSGRSPGGKPHVATHNFGPARNASQPRRQVIRAIFFSAIVRYRRCQGKHERDGAAFSGCCPLGRKRNGRPRGTRPAVLHYRLALRPIVKDRPTISWPGGVG